MATQHLYGPGDRYLNRNADTSPARSSSTERAGDRGGDELYLSSSTTNPNTQTYPPPHNALNPSYSLHPHSHSNSNPAPYDPSYNYVSNSNYNTASTAVLKDDSNLNRTGRTPSPTPSEAAELARKHVVDWGKIGRWRFWIRREWTWYYVLLFIILIVVILIAVYDKQIVGWLQPTAQKIQALPAGFLIPIGIFFVISFPPLFGQEILGILCGLVWGLWPGFGIVCAGTFLGELGNFFAFKYCCRSRGEKLEREKIMYACLARIVRDGGFKIALIARYSAIPGHFTTAIFSTCGLPVLTFCAAAILSLPKQFITVYVGVALEQSGTGTESSKSKVIEDSVLGVTIVVTALAMWYIFREMNKVKGAVVRERRKRRQAKLEAAGEYYPYGHTEDFNPHGSDSTLPLNPSDATHHQQWDAYGRAVGYVGDPRLEPIPGADTRGREGGRDRDSEIVAPLPLAPGRIPTFRTVGGGGYTSEGRRYEDPYSEPQPLNPIVDLSVGASRSPFRAPESQSRRQESVDSVGWELEQAGAEAYRMPPIAGVAGLGEDAERTPRNTAEGFLEQQQQQQRPVRSPFETTRDHEYIPPLAPPPGQRTAQSQIVQTRSPISPSNNNNTYVPYQTTSFPQSQLQSSTSPPHAHAHALSSPFDNPNSNPFSAPDFSEELLLVNPHSVLQSPGAGTGTGTRSPSSIGTRSPPSRVGTFSPPPPSYHSTAPL